MKTKIITTAIVAIVFSMLIQSCSNKQSITPFALYGDQKALMKVDKDGKVWIKEVGEYVSVLHPNGIVTSIKNDTIAIKKEDGKLYAQGNPIGKILNDGTIEFPTGEKLPWVDGALDIMGFKFKIKPNNKDLYSNASLLFLLYASNSNVEGTLPN